MAKFFENNLRPEESFAGYNVGEPDDDIFQIKDKEYPEDIEEYIYHEPETPIEEVQEIKPIINNEFDIDELIDNKPIIQEEKIEVNEVKNDIQELDNDSIWSSFDESDDNKSEDLLSTTSSNPVEIIEELKLVEPKETIQFEPDILESRKEISFDLDEDFKKQLAEQLEAKKLKQSSQNQPSIDNDPINNVQANDFVPIEETDNTQFFDLTEFGNERPSEKVDSKQAETGSETSEEKIETKKKEKRKLPWILTISAASIILLAGLAYLIMYYLIPNFYHKEEIAKKDSTHKIQDVVTKKLDKEVEKHEEKPIEKEIEKPVEEKEVAKEAEKKVEKESEEELIARINKQFEKKEEKAIEKKAKKEELIVEKPKEEIKIEKKKEIIVKKEEPKIKKPSVDKQHINEKPIISKESKILAKKEEKKIDIVKENKPIEVKKEENKIEAVYTIQVYSSPSKEDAMDWVEKLKSKNINASLSEQMIRDVKWYRVRFGSFSTREEAKAVALRNGFSQTWIDRVK